MISGHSFHGKLEGAIRQLEELAAEKAQRVDRLRREQSQLRKRVASALTQIARVQALALDADELEGYDAQTRTLDEGLGARRGEGVKLQASVRRCAAEVAALQDQEATVARELDAANEQWRDLARTVDQDLVRNAEHTALKKAANDAGERHGAAVAKVRAATEEMARKKSGYEQDPLFAYLLRVGYGTPAYKASNLVRTIDAWVARLCHFKEDVRDYEALMALPDYLNERAAAMEDAYNRAREQVASSRNQALHAAGGKPVVERIDDLEFKLGKIRERLKTAEDDSTQAQSAHLAFSNWEDDAARQLLETIQRTLATETLAQLADRVKRTESIEDDQALREVSVALDELQTCEAHLPPAQRAAQAAEARAVELRGVLSRYREKNYRSSDYDFDWNAERTLREYLETGLRAEDLWAKIAKSASYNPPNRPSRSSRSSSTSGGFGGGGFKSGGGFGGGGFTTGGGF